MQVDHVQVEAPKDQQVQEFWMKEKWVGQDQDKKREWQWVQREIVIVSYNNNLGQCQNIECIGIDTYICSFGFNVQLGQPYMFIFTQGVTY